MITAGSLVVRKRTLSPGLLRFGKAVSSQHVHIGGAKFEGQIAQLLAQTLADFFTCEHDAFEIFAMNALLCGLMHQVIHERWNADQHGWLEASNEPDIALGAHHLAAA